MAHRIDNTLARTGRIIPIANVKRVGSIPNKEKGSFIKTRKNLREKKIRKGKRIKTPLQFIEKRGKPVINTKGEKRELKAFNQQRLRNLAKARKVRMKNLKKRK